MILEMSYRYCLVQRRNVIMAQIYRYSMYNECRMIIMNFLTFLKFLEALQKFGSAYHSFNVKSHKIRIACKQFMYDNVRIWRPIIAAFYIVSMPIDLKCMIRQYLNESDFNLQYWFSMKTEIKIAQSLIFRKLFKILHEQKKP